MILDYSGRLCVESQRPYKREAEGALIRRKGDMMLQPGETGDASPGSEPGMRASSSLAKERSEILTPPPP